MRLLFVARAYYPAVRYGGPVTSLRRICNLLAQSGHHVRVVCSDMASPGFFGERIPAGELELDHVHVSYLRSQFRFHWETFCFAALKQIPAAVRSADVVHVAGTRHYLGVLAEKAASRIGVPYFIMPEGSVPPRSRNVWGKGFFDVVHTKKSMLRADGIIASSDQEAEDLVRWGLPRSTLVSLPPRGGEIEKSIQEHPELRLNYGVPRPAKILLWIGRIHREKGLELLFDALTTRQLGSVHLLIGGLAEDKAYGAHIQSVAKAKLGTRVHFLGWVDSEMKSKLLSISDLFVFPSQKENFGMSVADAVAAGVPVLVTEGCGIASRIRDRAGLVCEYDSNDISQKLIRILFDSSLHARLRKGATQVAQEFQWPRVVSMLESAYRAALVSGSH